MIDADSSRNSASGYWLMIALLASVAMFKSLNDTLDPDCFWHLRVAEQLTSQGIGPLVDHFSFNSIKQTWTPYSWLAELSMKSLWNFGGYQAAVVASAAFAGGFVVMVAVSCAALAGPNRRLNVIVMAALAACLALPCLSFRPATIAILLLAVCAFLLMHVRRLEGTSKSVWLIVPITALLVNIHLTAALVPLWAACMLVGAMVEQPRSAGLVRRYAMLLAGTVVACLLTPMLSGTIRTGWYYQFHDPMVIGGAIEEMRAFYSGFRGTTTAAVLAILTMTALWNWRRLPIGVWLCFAMCAVLLVNRARFAPIFAIIAAPVLATALPALPDIVLSRQILRTGAAGLLMISLICCVILLPRPGVPLATWLNRKGPGAFGYPCGAAEYVQNHVLPTSGGLINEFTWGGYLIWRLGDRYQVFVDGRTQLYPAEFWRSTYLCGEATRTTTLARVRADAAVLPTHDSFFRDALAKLGWTSAYRDQFAEVMLPPTSAQARR